MQLDKENTLREEKAALQHVLLPHFTALILLGKEIHLWEGKSAF